MLKIDDIVGGGLVFGLILFALTGCSFEKPDPEAEELDNHIAELDEMAEMSRGNNAAKNYTANAGDVFAEFDTPELNFGAGQPSAGVSQPSADQSVEASSVDVTPDTTGSRPLSCAVATTTDGDREEALRIYSDICAGYPRPDCDPAEGGGWQCASQQIAEASPEWVENKTPIDPVLLPPIDIVIEGEPDAPVTPPETSIPEPEVPSKGPRVVQAETAPIADGWSFVQDPAGYEGDGAYIWLGRNNFELVSAGQGVLAYDFEIETEGEYEVTVRSHITEGPGQSNLPADKNNDVWLRVNGGSWVKVFHQNKEAWTSTLPFDADLTVGTTTVELSGRSQYFVVDSVTVSPKGFTATTGDLYALHYDVCPDKDDIHAMAANHMVTDKLGLPNVLGVIGTCGREIADRYDNAGTLLFDQLYPDGLNAHANYAGSVVSAAAQWEETLNAGFNVVVAEGGQSDFTADVVRNISSSLHGGITLVQHASGYNEGNTDPANLAYLRSNINYINIDNGNQSNNSTANLASWQLGLQDPDPFIDVVLDSKYSRYWVEAFNQLSPYCRPQSFQCRVDFSDTVALLYLVGDTTTTDILTFANRYSN